MMNTTLYTQWYPCITIYTIDKFEWKNNELLSTYASQPYHPI